MSAILTHAVIRLAHPPVGPIQPTDCPGPVERVYGSFDRCDGHLVEVYHCSRCFQWIAIDAHTGRTRNDYPGPREMVRKLADMYRVAPPARRAD